MILDDNISKMLNDQPEYIISDYDNVLQTIDLSWLLFITTMGDQDYFSNFFDKRKFILDTEKSSGEEIFNFLNAIFTRNEYYLDKWMLLPNVKYTDEAKKKWMDLYMNNPIFYTTMSMNPIAYALRDTLSQKFCQELTILSHTPNGLPDQRKITKLKLFFGPELYKKIKVKFLRPSSSKAKWINKYRPNWTLFIDDRFDIIKEVALECNCENKTLLMPKLGYNRDYIKDELFNALLIKKNILFSDYDKIFAMHDNETGNEISFVPKF